jgi:hypothetical protein
MRPTNWLSSFLELRFLCLFLALAFIGSACVDESSEISSKGNNADKKAAKLKSNSNSNSQSNFGDYNIEVSVAGKVWTYTITKNPGAKGLSHFVLNFQNCGGSSSNIDNIVWATVNGQPAIISNSEGNTGCNVEALTTNFVKFDDLKDADSYTIVFELDKLIGNFVTSTAWLKAGTSCFAYQVVAPCCPL